MIRPHLEYGNVIWSLQLKRQSIAHEKVQRRATKLVKSYKDLPYNKRLQILNLPTLKYRRCRGDLVQLYKIINNIDDLDFDKFFTSNTNVTRNHELKINVNYSRTNLRKHCFTNRVVKYWNALNPITRTSSNVNMFKSLLDFDNNRMIGCFDCNK